MGPREMLEALRALVGLPRWTFVLLMFVGIAVLWSLSLSDDHRDYGVVLDPFKRK